MYPTYVTYTTLVVGLLYLLIALALTVSAIRLMWIAGNFLKQKQARLPQDLINRT